MTRYIHCSLPRLYYLATPAFIALDYWGGVSVRVAVLNGYPVYKSLYYGFCILCGVAAYLLPEWSVVVALCESPVNLLITILGLFLPYVERVRQFDNILDGDWTAVPQFSSQYVTNLLLAAGISAFAFLQANKALSERFEAAARPHGHRPERMRTDSPGRKT